jgi:DNA polymerase III alpha subunit
MPSKNFASPHVHVRSFDSASTPEAFALRELEIGSEFLTCTDHGTLEANRQVYDLCKDDKRFKGKLTPILGLEAYFRDDDCPILQDQKIEKSLRYRNQLTNKVVTVEAFEKLSPEEKQIHLPETGYWDHLKYMHLTMHFMDQEAFETAVRLISKADLRAEQHGSERKPLFGWKDLEELGSKNVTFCSSCLIGMVSRHLLNHNDYQTAIRYYDRLRNTVKPGNFYVEMFPHSCDRNWDAGTFLKYADGTEEKLPDWKNLLIEDVGNKAEAVKALKVAEDFQKNAPAAREKYQKLLAVMQNRKMTPLEAPKLIVGAEHREGYLQNECSPWAPDGAVQIGVNRFVLEVAKKFGDKILISDDSHFAKPEEKVAQDVRLGQNGSWRFSESHHRFTNAEAWEFFRDRMGISESEFQGWVDNSQEWGSRFKDFTFKARKVLPTSFYPADTLTHVGTLIEKHGRMDWSNAEYVKRLQAEINLLHYNGTIDLLPYFFIDEEVCDLYLKSGLLTGPGRGSAAGLLLTYLLGITHVDPLRYGLSMDRFMTKTRIESGKYPDIDQDLPHRDLLVDKDDPTKGWLTERFGENVAQISTDTTMKLKSAVKDTFRAMYGVGSPQLTSISKLTNEFPMPPQGIEDYDFVFGYKGSDDTWKPGAIETDPVLMKFAKDFPKEWETVQQCLGMTRQKGRHACAFVIADEPISNFIPMTTVGGVRCTQFTASTVESSGGLKMDFLIVNSLRDIGACLRLVQDRHGQEIDWKPARMSYKERQLGGNLSVPGMRIGGKFVPHIRCVPWKGAYHDIWDLPEDQAVFRDICEAKTESVFQFNTPGARGYLRDHFDAVRMTEPDGTVHKGLDSIEALSAFTALDRPGGLDVYVENRMGKQHNMLVEYAERAKGNVPNGDPELIPVLMDMLPETFGVIVYQEQLTRIFQVLGKTTGAEADEFRVHVSKKQMAKVLKDKAVFMTGAVERLGLPVAEKLWTMMEAWARYGFNKSHAICYVVITYACAFLKHHYPLEWWTAVLKNADRNEINEKFWVHCGKYIDLPEITKSGAEFTVIGDRIQAPFWLLKGIGDKAQEQIVANGPYTSIEDFCRKIQQWRVANGTNVTRTKTNKKTGEDTIVQSRRLATTALNSRVVTTLIVSGAMDTLFPDIEMEIDGVVKKFPMTAAQKIAAYEQADAKVVLEVTGKKKPKKKGGDDLRTIDPLVQYQMRKQILPALSEPLMDLVKPLIEGKLTTLKKGTVGIHHKPIGVRSEYQDYPMANGALLERINEADLAEELIYGAVAYVTAERRWRYENKDTSPGAPKTKQAVELTLDVEGVTMKAVKWPLENGLPPPFDKPLAGAVVVCLFRRRPRKNASLDDILVVQHPLDAKLEEASPEAEESNE